MEQGLFFNDYLDDCYGDESVAIPLEQGLFFNGDQHGTNYSRGSQSLWSRDYFLIHLDRLPRPHDLVAIPLEQGLFFNRTRGKRRAAGRRRNPFGAGTIF